MSKMTIATAKFQDMVARSAKGASENKLLPITSLISIELKDNVLTLTTTDTLNTLKILSDKVEGDDMQVVVPVEIFSKLIARTTSENITLRVTENSLEVRGNGTYNIPLLIDEDGAVKFPEYKFTKKGEAEILNLTTVKNILSINKAAVATTIDTPCLCGYYLGEQVITTNEQAICFNGTRVLKDDYLISPEMMELLSLNTEEKISCYYNNGYFLFETSDVILHGAEHDDKDLYPAEEISGYLEENFPSMCSVPKILLQSVIDRLALFIEPYDKNGAYFTFTKDGLRITSKKSSSVEVINYQKSTNFTPFVCCVDIPLFKAQIDATPGEETEIWYGHESAIKLTSGKVMQVIALLEDDSLESINGEK